MAATLSTKNGLDLNGKINEELMKMSGDSGTQKKSESQLKKALNEG